MEVAGETIKLRADSAFFKSGNINYELIAHLVKDIDMKLTQEDNPGSILIFMPGVPEINRAIKAINNIDDYWTLPLHSSLSSQEQKRFSNLLVGREKWLFLQILLKHQSQFLIVWWWLILAGPNPCFWHVLKCYQASRRVVFSSWNQTKKRTFRTCYRWYLLPFVH